ncbi:glycoside hydrolase family protein [Motiliproteus sediminis]|uniref:glycoside hydrolase family protein n=1 Tax=Motiliproteus sediminis TaxID=1468178 RepID=UPI001AEFC4A4|nr:glycoside hydrolase family protein [Motiliproteus sediminis]
MNREQLKQDIRTHEGVINHLYQDTRGNATIGVGQLVPDAAYARTLPLVHRDNRQPASGEEIDAEYARVMAEPPAMVASRYRSATELILPDDEIDKVLDQRVDEFMAGLSRHLPGFEQFPEGAQQALLDMAFNLGVGGLTRKFPKLMRAAKQQDWQTCAAECSRRGIGDQRNAATRALFDGACRA